MTESTRSSELPLPCYCADPEDDLSAIDQVKGALAQKAHGRVLIVDFDETLWLRNSTEEYLSCLRPRFLGYIILVTLDVLRPWKFIGRGRKEHIYRDWIRILICTVLLPWSLPLWRRRANELANRYANEELIQELRQSSFSPIYVATLGTDAIISPILRHILPTATLCAAGTFWSGYRIRTLGKKAWIEKLFGAGALENAIVITDSEHDADLLDFCSVPVLVKWPRAEYKVAFSDAYVPFLYTQRAKRPGENYMLYGVLLEDVVLLCLAMAWLMPVPAAGALGLLFLHLSFWTIYEIGYVENDMQAARREAAPMVASAATPYSARLKVANAWLACLGFAVPGVWLLIYFNPSNVRIHYLVSSHPGLFIIVLLAWLAFVGLSRIAYWTYNRLDVKARPNLYIILQLFRTVGYSAFLDINYVGCSVLLSLVFARWVKYLVYRDVGRTLEEDQRFLMLCFFVVIEGAQFAAADVGAISFQALAALLWLSAYSHRSLIRHIRQLKLVRLGA